MNDVHQMMQEGSTSLREVHHAVQELPTEARTIHRRINSVSREVREGRQEMRQELGNLSMLPEMKTMLQQLLNLSTQGLFLYHRIIDFLRTFFYS